MERTGIGKATVRHDFHVKCHSCGREMRMEEARPRGGLWSGFICPDCFGSQARTAFVVVGLISLILIFFMVGNQNRRSRSQPRDSGLRTGIPSGHVSLGESGVATDISEIIAGAVNIYLPTRGYQRSWRSRLFTPLTQEKLNRANFAYGSELLDTASEGSVVSETPDRIKIVVRAPTNLYFWVVQDRKEMPKVSDPNHGH